MAIFAFHWPHRARLWAYSIWNVCHPIPTRFRPPTFIRQRRWPGKLLPSEKGFRWRSRNLRLREALRLQSTRDTLTGLFNRRYMEETLERELKRAARNKESVSVLMFDIDHFKKFNDTFGHQAGDTLLREFGEFLMHKIRGHDIACRYGGEEFAVILPGASFENGLKRADALRAGVKELVVQHAGQVLGMVTVSIGVSAFPGRGNSDDLLRAADEALYRAKAGGRDSVVADGLQSRRSRR